MYLQSVPNMTSISQLVGNDNVLIRWVTCEQEKSLVDDWWMIALPIRWVTDRNTLLVVFVYIYNEHHSWKLDIESSGFVKCSTKGISLHSHSSAEIPQQFKTPAPGYIEVQTGRRHICPLENCFWLINLLWNVRFWKVYTYARKQKNKVIVVVDLRSYSCRIRILFTF